MIDLPTSELLSKFGAGNHKPGSGSAAALQGMLSIHLLRTVIDLTKDPKRAKEYAAQLPNLLKIDAALKDRLLPNLERLFHEDSLQFDRVIRLRQEREASTEPAARRLLRDEAIAALVPATEVPISIAKDCLEIAGFALEVFDHGFQSARGDSGVALNAALSGASGCLSIVELNLLSFETNEWTETVRTSCSALLTELDSLSTKARSRLSMQIERAERKALLSKELKHIASVIKGKKSISEREIETIAVRLQRVMWRDRDLIWKANAPDSPFAVLQPEKALKSFGLDLEQPATLGQHLIHGAMVEVAGQIDQRSRLVSISMQFPRETQSFTMAHELGHYLLHTQPILHRDRPLDGAESDRIRDGDEWQADKFATHFLMPRKLVKRTFSSAFLTDRFEITEKTAFALNEGTPEALISKCRTLRGLSRLLAGAGFYNGVHFYPLAQQFGVSIEAMAIRLEELELIEF